MHAQGGLPIPGVIHVAQPWWWGDGGEMSPDEFGLWAAREVGRAIDRLGAENVAAFIGEPVQGAGGVIVPPDTTGRRCERICRDRDVLIVSDEVICGFGRLGSWFGSQHFGFTPDLMTIAKGLTSGYLPMGGVMVGDAVADVLGRAATSTTAITTSGHPVCAAAAMANIGILRDEGLVERVRDRDRALPGGALAGAGRPPAGGRGPHGGADGRAGADAGQGVRARFPKPGEIGTCVPRRRLPRRADPARDGGLHAGGAAVGAERGGGGSAGGADAAGVGRDFGGCGLTAEGRRIFPGELSDTC